MKKIRIMVVMFVLLVPVSLYAQKKKEIGKKEKVVFMADSTQTAFSLTIVDGDYYFTAKGESYMRMLNPEKIKSVDIEQKESVRFAKDEIIRRYDKKIVPPIMIVTMK